MVKTPIFHFVWHPSVNTALP